MVRTHTLDPTPDAPRSYNPTLPTQLSIKDENSKNLKLRQSGKAQVLLLILVRQSDRETDVAPNVTGEANDSLTYRNANCKSSDTLFSVIDFFPDCMT